MKKLPYSQDAEIALLGTLLVYPESVDRIREYNLQVDDFYNTEHRQIFQKMLDILDGGSFLDTTTLISKLKDHGELERVGGMNYMLLLSSNAAAPATIKHYIDVVQSKSQMRRLIEVSQAIVDKGFDSTTELNTLLDFAEKNVLAVTQSRQSSEMQSSREVVEMFMENLAKIRENKDRITGLRTGFDSLNRLTNGLQRGDLVILAARPSVGKTAFALNLGLNVARNNLKGKASVAIFSLEMPATHLMSRLLSAQSTVKSENLRSGSLNNEQANDLNAAAGILSNTNIFIDDSATVTVPEIFSKCRKLKAEVGLDLIVIDYIQLITGRGKADSRQQEVSEISRSLKQLAREMDVPVIALSQLSRNVEKREDKTPQLSDLRESGSIEQDADIVMFLYREAYYDEDRTKEDFQKQETQEVSVIVAKHRNGALGRLELQFNPSITKFYDVRREYS